MIFFLETKNDSCYFAWLNGNIIGSEGIYDSMYEYSHCNSNYQDCLWFAPCDETNHWECQTVSQKGGRWYKAQCDAEDGNHLNACMVLKGKQLNMTGIFTRKLKAHYLYPAVRPLHF